MGFHLAHARGLEAIATAKVRTAHTDARLLARMLWVGDDRRQPTRRNDRARHAHAAGLWPEPSILTYRAPRRHLAIMRAEDLE